MENRNRSNMTLGAILVAVGILLFLGQISGLRDWGEFWPFIIIGVGAAFFAGMLVGGKQTGGLAIPGSIIITVGLILLVQNMFNVWETWSYAWALIIAAIGFGQLVHGTWSDQPELRRQGWRTVRAGLVLFVVFGTLMEFIFSMTGVSNRGGQLFWPVMLTIVGLLWLAARVYRLLTAGQPAEGEPIDLFWPILLTGIGAMATLSGLGWMPAFRLGSLLNLWPVLLIAAGIQLLFGRRNAWVSAILGILVVGTLLVVGFAGDRLGLDNNRWFFAPNFTVGDWAGGERMVGSGQSKEEARSVSGFNRVSFDIPGEVEIVQGTSEALMISADDNLLEYITSEVRGRELVVSVKRGYSLQPRQTIKVQLTVKELEQVSIPAAANVKITDLQTGDLKLIASGAGNFNLSGLQADALDIVISGLGSVTAAGQSERVELIISGSGNFNAAELQAKRTHISLSGLGSATVWTSEMLDVEISGAGSINYYGDPQVDQQISGLGNVKRLGSK